MRIIDLETAFVMKKVITYADDHDTVVIRQRPVRHIGGMIYHGKVKAPGTHLSTCKLYCFLPGVDVGLDVDNIDPERHLIAEIVASTAKNGYGSQGDFMAMLDRTVFNGQFISKAMIEFSRHASPERTERLIAARNRCLTAREQQEKERRARYDQEDAAFCAKRNQEAKALISAALETIRSGGTLVNKDITLFITRYDSSTHSLVNYIARQYNVNIPLKVQGWINSSLYSVFIQNARCESYRHKKGSASKTFYTYFDQVIAAVLAENPEQQTAQQVL